MQNQPEQEMITMAVYPGAPSELVTGLSELSMILGDMSWMLGIRAQEIIVDENEKETTHPAIFLIVRYFKPAMEAVYLLSKVVEELEFPEFLVNRGMGDDHQLMQELRQHGEVEDRKSPILYRGFPLQLVMFSQHPSHPDPRAVSALCTPTPVEGWTTQHLWAELSPEQKQEYKQDDLEMAERIMRQMTGGPFGGGGFGGIDS